MTRIFSTLKSYPLVISTLLVAIAGLILLATPASRIVPWGLSGYVLLVAAWEAVGMVRQLIAGHAGLDILAVTAMVASVLVGEPWAALVVVLMLTGGAALEDYAQSRSQRELTALLRRAPQRATRIVAAGAEESAGAGRTGEGQTGDGQSGEAAAGAVAGSASAGAQAGEPDNASPQTEEIDVEDVAVGDVLLVRPGGVVPVNAVLSSAHGVFDESSLTGESLPVERHGGERVSSGAVNGATAVTMRAAALAGDSEYQQIVRLVEQAAGSKAKVVRLADRYAVPFTVLSLVIAALAWVVGGQAVRFAEVLVVATPCPLLIAAPVAFLGGMSRAARFGLIVKGGGTLEQLSSVRSVAFDKTGTITTGRPSLQRLLPEEGFGRDEVLQLAASAEVYSSHVLASSVVREAKRRGLRLHDPENAREIATNGVEAQLSAAAGESPVTVRVGKPSWLRDFAPDIRPVTLAAGELAIYVAVDDRYAGAIVMRDQVRREAAGALAQLDDLGIERTLMVTGDVAATAEPIAADLGIDEVHTQCRPADKVDIVGSVQPRPLIMVGDGLNDAPVLAAADIGFAMGARGATAASESADVVNRFDSLAALPRAVRIGKETVRIALQSIWLGIIISVILMVIAAFGFLPAIVGAWLQEAVDLLAILGALRAVGPRSEQGGRLGK